MSESLKLLSKVLEGPSHYLESRRLGVSAKLFPGENDQLVWIMIEDYFNRHNNVPPVEDVIAAIPTFAVIDYGKLTLSEMAERLRKSIVEASLRSITYELDAYLPKQKFKDAIEGVHKRLSEATNFLTTSRDVLMSTHIDEVQHTYKEIRDGTFTLGIPWPWKPLNEGTRGIEPGTFSVFYARPKTTKTFRLLEIAITAQAAGNKVLIVSCEMQESVLLNRLAAVKCGFDYGDFRNGKLSVEDEMKLSEFVEEFQNIPSEREIPITTLSDDKDGKSVSALRAKIDEHEPDLVLIDSMYKMYDEHTKKRDASPGTLRNVCYDIQQLCQTTRVPIVCTSQANRSGDKAKIGETTDVAFSDSMLMDCDLLVRLINDKELGRTIFAVNAARETVLEGFSTGNKMCDGMGPVMFGGEPDWSIPTKYLPGGSGEEEAGRTASSDSRFT